MPDKFRIVQPYRAEVEVFEGNVHQVSGDRVVWETGEDTTVYPSDVIDDYLLEASVQPYEQGKNVIYPSDILKVQKKRTLRFGKFTLNMGWATVFDRAPTEFREVNRLISQEQ